MTNYPDQPSGANEFAPLESTPQQPDPYAPVDYPTTSPGAPPTVLGPAYPAPPGYPQTPAYPPPPVAGYPAAPGYPAPPQPYGGGYPFAADPYNPYGQMQPQNPTNGMAVASLIVSIASLVLTCGTASFIGLILGIIGMRETKRTGQQGYGMALAGVIIGAIPTVLWVLYLGGVFVLLILGAASGTT